MRNILHSRHGPPPKEFLNFAVPCFVPLATCSLIDHQPNSVKRLASRRRLSLGGISEALARSHAKIVTPVHGTSTSPPKCFYGTTVQRTQSLAPQASRSPERRSRCCFLSCVAISPKLQPQVRFCVRTTQFSATTLPECVRVFSSKCNLAYRLSRS